MKGSDVVATSVTDDGGLAGIGEAGVALVFDRLDHLIEQIDDVCGEIRALACARHAAEQPHPTASCAVATPQNEDDLLTADGRQAACRACLT